MKYSLVFALLLCWGATSKGQVTLFDKEGFNGKSKTLTVGEHRLPDFDDLASSIRVAPGYVAVLYEHADTGGGYGVSVDLIEDHQDLSDCRFNNLSSFVSVFAARKSNLVYVRGRMDGGRFTAGHWERTRADGNQQSAAAVVAPSLPPHAPSGPTIVERRDSQSVITSLGNQTSFEAAAWDQAERDGIGVIGSDYRGPEAIGSAAFQRASNNPGIPDFINFWYPQKQPRDHRGIVYFKRTLAGLVDTQDEPYVVDIDGTYEDHDFTVHIKPSPSYQYLIRDGHGPEQANMQALKTLAAERENPRNACDEPFKLVEAEISSSEKVKGTLKTLLNQRIGQLVSVYGPWIYDKGHCHQPEIHPAEQIWWSETMGTTRKYHLNLFCDSSKRFWWRKQMDDGTRLKPWGAPPIRGIFAISFETEIGKAGRKFEVTGIEDYNVVEFPNSNKVYTLAYQGTTLVSFLPKNNAFKVSYEQVGLKPGTTNMVRGFLVIETSVGTVTQISSGRIAITAPGSSAVVYVDVPKGADPEKVNVLVEAAVFKKVEGHYMFSVLGSDVQPSRSTAAIVAAPGSTSN